MVSDEADVGDAGRRRVILAVAGTLVVLIALPIILYLGDALVLRQRLAGGGGRETITVYFATRLKSGKLEVFTDRPQTEVCARALFPHFGYRPCWYVRRTGGVKVI
jgi:hypothetical protein